MSRVISDPSSFRKSVLSKLPTPWITSTHNAARWAVNKQVTLSAQTRRPMALLRTSMRLILQSVPDTGGKMLTLHHTQFLLDMAVLLKLSTELKSRTTGELLKTPIPRWQRSSSRNKTTWVLSLWGRTHIWPANTVLCSQAYQPSFSKRARGRRRAMLQPWTYDQSWTSGRWLLLLEI